MDAHVAGYPSPLPPHRHVGQLHPDWRAVLAVGDNLGALLIRLVQLQVKLGQLLVADIHTSDLHNTTTQYLICPPPVEILGASVPGSNDVELVGGDEGVASVLLQEGVVAELLLRALLLGYVIRDQYPTTMRPSSS